MGVCSRFIFSKRGHIDWPITNIFEGHFPIEPPLWTAKCKVENKLTHLLHLYTWELNFGQTVWDISEVLSGTFWWPTWELGEPFGNFMAWQHPPKKERTRPLIRSHLEVAGSNNTATWLATWRKTLHHLCLTEENLKTSHNKECITMQPCHLH